MSEVKRYMGRDLEDERGSEFYRAEDVQSLLREVLPHVKHLDSCALDERFGIYRGCDCPMYEVHIKLKAIIEAT